MDVSASAELQRGANHKMEVLGYVHLRDLGKPSPEVVEGVKKELQDLSTQDASPEAMSVSAKGGPRCDQFMGHGFDMRTTVKEYIRNPLFVRQGPRPVVLRRSQQGRAHLKKDQAVGLFKVAPGGDPITFRLSLPGTTDPVTTIILHEDELLFVTCSVTVIIEISSVRALIWDGYASLPVGLDILNEDVLDFVMQGARGL